MDIDARAFGQLEGEVKALREMMVEQNTALKGLREQLETVNSTLSEVRGGSKTLLLALSLAGALGGFIAWAVSHIKW